MLLPMDLIDNKNQKHRIRALIDCGADKIYASQRIGKIFRDTQHPVQSRPVEVANGDTICSKMAVYLRARHGNFTDRIEARVLDLPHYDLILGMKWLNKWNPHIEWGRRILTITKEGKTHKLNCDGKAPALSTAKNQTSFAQLFSMRTISKKERKEVLKNGYLWLIHKRKEGNEENGVAPISVGEEFDEKHEISPTQDFTDEQLETLLPKKQSKLRRLINSFKKVFRAKLPEKLPPNRTFDHAIPTGTEAPVNNPPFRLSELQLQEQRKQIKELLEKGLIRLSESEWGSPVLFVPKPGGKWRMCIDYRPLNDKTRKNTYPLPRIDEGVLKIGKGRIFSKLDMVSGYWQVRVKEEDIPKTAFNTRDGKYEFLVMPFGLTNAPATFQTMMNTILFPCLSFVEVYLDDIVVYSQTEDEHVEHLRRVLTCLEQNGLYASPEKCTLGTDSVVFCGHEIGQGRVRPLREKAALITHWPQPRTVRQVRQFIGFASYYRTYLKGFTQTATPIFNLLKEDDAEARKNKHRPITWNRQCQYAFAKLKQQLSSRPFLVTPDPSKPIRVQTDASDYAVGYALEQHEGNDQWQPIVFDGRKLSGAEINYPVHEKELLAVKEALRHYHHLLDGREVTIITDHHSLQYMNTIQNPSRRMARWIDEFQQYNLNFVYRKGKLAVIPDALSRHPLFKPPAALNTLSEGSANSEDPFLEIVSQERKDRENEWLQALRQLLKGETVTVSPEVQRRLGKSVIESYWLDPEGEIRLKRHGFSLAKTRDEKYHSSAPFVPMECRIDLVHKTHKKYGHFSWSSLQGILGPLGWWPGQDTDVKLMVKFCPRCQLTQPHQQKDARTTFHRVRNFQPFECWGIDIMGELPRSMHGNRFIIAAIDYATGWPVTQAVPEVTAPTVSEFLYNLVMEYGPPRTLISDNGPQFISDTFAHLVQQLKVKHQLVAPYHPQSNGKIERFNGILGPILTKLMIGDRTVKWDEYLPAATYAARVRAQSGSRLSPFYLVYGREPLDFEIGWAEVDKRTNPSDKPTIPTHDEDLGRLERIRTARQLHYEELLKKATSAGFIDDSRITKDDLEPKFAPGTYVLVRKPKDDTKFTAKWFGPYKVIKASALGTYVLQDDDQKVLRNLVHQGRMVQAYLHGATPRTWNAPTSEHQLLSSTDLDAVLDEERRRGTDFSRMPREQWDWINASWRSGTSKVVYRTGPRRFFPSAVPQVSHDAGRKARQVVQDQARRLRLHPQQIYLRQQNGEFLPVQVVSQPARASEQQQDRSVAEPVAEEMRIGENYGIPARVASPEPLRPTEPWPRTTDVVVEAVELSEEVPEPSRPSESGPRTTNVVVAPIDLSETVPQSDVDRNIGDVEELAIQSSPHQLEAQVAEPLSPSDATPPPAPELPIVSTPHPELPNSSEEQALLEEMLEKDSPQDEDMEEGPAAPSSSQEHLPHISRNVEEELEEVIQWPQSPRHETQGLLDYEQRERHFLDMDRGREKRQVKKTSKAREAEPPRRRRQKGKAPAYVRVQGKKRRIAERLGDEEIEVGEPMEM